MANCYGHGHMLIVRRQSFIPNYFSVYESQLPIENEYSEYKSEAADSERRGSRFCLLYCGNLTPENHLQTRYFTFPFWKKAEKFMESETQTTRLLSSGLARRFSCNVSKMAYRMRSRMVCDGYYGCLDETFSKEKESGGSLKRGKPVCILPWKKRKRCPKLKKKQTSSKAPRNETQICNVDCVVTSLERAKVSGIKVRSHVTRYQQGIGTKSHPAMFYSYYIAKGHAVQYRKICAPKRRPCDGYFGCYNDGSVRVKKTGKWKPILKTERQEFL